MAQEVLIRNPGSRTAGCIILSRLSPALIFFLAVSSNAWAASDWTVLRETGADNTCVLRSKPAAVYDGYQESIATLLISPASLYVISKSVFDPTFADIGMQVDHQAFISVDGIEDRRRATFNSHYEEIVTEFKAGREVSVQMRFWPTWPAQGLFPARFSLMGFTKAYEELLLCR